MNHGTGDALDIHFYLRSLRRHWFLIGFVMTICAVGAGFLTSQMTPMYQSTSQIFISTNNSSEETAYQSGLFSAQRVASYAKALTGRELAAQVIDRLDLEMSPDVLKERVTGEADAETVLMRISVTDPNPAQAQQLTEAYGEELQELVADLETPAGKNKPVLKATVIDSASRPENPVSPNMVRNLAIALALGLILGGLLAALRELLDNTVKDGDTVTSITGVSVTGRINLDSTVRQQPLISQIGSHEPRAEAFRMLRTNLQYVDVDGDHKAYVITSALPGEGKSSTAANLAISIAQTGRKVVLIDADLRKPRTAQLLGLEPSVGLTTVLVGKVDLADAIQNTDAGVAVLTSGHLPPNPAELLQTKAMHSLVQRLREEYDFVIIDSPPLLPVTDAALLTRFTDGALLVIRHGHTTREHLRHAREQLDNVGTHAVGAVLNMVPARGGIGYSYYGYYGYYGYEAPDQAKKDLFGRRKAAKPSRKDRRANLKAEKAASRLAASSALAKETLEAASRTAAGVKRGTEEKPGEE